jgi:hypothetical protein
LEAPNSGLGLGPEAPIDRARVSARLAQAPLQRPHALGAVGIAIARPGGDQRRLPLERGRGQRPDQPVDRQSLATLKAPHGGLGQGPEEPIDRPRVSARSAQAPLQRAHALGVVGIVVTRTAGDQLRRGPRAIRLALGLGGRGPCDQQERRAEGDRDAAGKCGMDCRSHCLLLLE